MAASQKLDRRQVAAWTVRRTSVLRVDQGALWLTRTGDPSDSVVEAGQTLALPRGRWVAQALADSRYAFDDWLPQEVLDGQTTLLPVLQRL